VQFPAFDVSMTWHQRFHRDPGSEWLRSVFVTLFDSLRVPFEIEASVFRSPESSR